MKKILSLLMILMIFSAGTVMATVMADENTDEDGYEDAEARPALRNVANEERRIDRGEAPADRAEAVLNRRE
ncbi:MAG: hypothetical protein ACOC32_00900, partial [Nanoarchaeota archaeon]